MATKIPKKILARQHEITSTFLLEVDKHLADLLNERVMEMFEIRDFANLMFIHPTHLSNTIKLTTGHAPCYFYEEKILNISKSLLEKNDRTIGSIATLLTYDPSNFTKFFKHFTGLTPKQYRESKLKPIEKENTVLLTI